MHMGLFILTLKDLYVLVVNAVLAVTFFFYLKREIESFPAPDSKRGELTSQQSKPTKFYSIFFLTIAILIKLVL